MTNMASNRSNNRIETTIYGKNEEITPEIDLENENDTEINIENEESSENEIEFYMNDEASEYDRMMMDFNESSIGKGCFYFQ